MTESKNEILTIAQVMERSHVKRQTVYAAMKAGGLKGFKINNKWHIYEKDRVFYMANKYNREKGKINGEPVFDETKQEISVSKAAKIAGVPRQKIYYLIRRGYLKGVKKGYAHVISFEDLKAYFLNIEKESQRQLQLL